MRDTLIFYRSFYEAIKELPEKNQAELYIAIFEYSLNFNEVQLSGLSKTIFLLIKPQLEANNKRFENGKKAKKNQKVSKTQAKPNQNESKTEANNNNNLNNNEKEVIENWEFEKNQFLRDEGWMYKFCTEMNIDYSALKVLIKDFIVQTELKEDHKTCKELKKHFTNTFNLNKKNGLKNNNFQKVERQTAPPVKYVQ